MPTDRAPAAPSRPGSAGLVLQPFRATRPTADGSALAALLCPPYDVIDPATRSALLAASPDNFVEISLPEPTAAGYAHAAAVLSARVESEVMAVDAADSLYVYELTQPDGHVTRGLVGAVELHDPVDGVILPHEDTMGGPVADRLALMTATDADLEPIFLLYDGGGPASAVVRTVDDRSPVADTVTPDGMRHRLWALTDPETLEAIRADLSTRHALIADGHHRYATYRERQRLGRQASGAGPWDYGLSLLVDSNAYGPQVHPIHRVARTLSLANAVDLLSGIDTRTLDLAGGAALSGVADAALRSVAGFAVVLTDGEAAVLVHDADGSLRDAASEPGESGAVSGLDVTVLHRALVHGAWRMPDDIDHVGYAHSVSDAVSAARACGGFAVVLRATPAASVAEVAAEGARMPRKSTLFTPKPASGLFLRRLTDAGPATDRTG